MVTFVRAGLGFDYFHSPQDMPQFQPGWQEPGLWRPKWIMERNFVSEEGKLVKKDKLIFKLKQDRTMKIFSQKKRPFLEIWKKKDAEMEKKRKLFETGKEDAVNTVEDQIKKKLGTLHEFNATLFCCLTSEISFLNVLHCICFYIFMQKPKNMKGLGGFVMRLHSRRGMSNSRQERMCMAQRKKFFTMFVASGGLLTSMLRSFGGANYTGTKLIRMVLSQVIRSAAAL